MNKTGKVPDPTADEENSGAGREVALVIPIYNEGPVIAKVLSEAKTIFPHIICVDDGSVDDSAALARAAGATVLTHAINLGQGAALQTGITYYLQATDLPYVATFDADGQHRTDDVVSMWERAKTDEFDIIFGSRFLSERQEMGAAKRIVLKTAAWATARTTHMELTLSLIHI